MSTRKRTRSQIHEEDELSPEKEVTSTPLAGIKKRKLNANGSSPASVITGSLKRTIGGIFGWRGKEKENLREEDEEDELASEECLGSGKHRAPERDIYDLDASELKKNGMQKRQRGSVSTKATPTANKTRFAIEKASAKTNQAPEAEDIWEVPEDETSAIRSSRKLARSVEKAKAVLTPVVQDEKNTPTTRSPGRPKKSQILREDMKLSKKAARERMMATTSEGDEEEEAVTPKKWKPARSTEDMPAQRIEIVISAKRQKPQKLGKGDSQGHSALKSAASNGKRGRPRRPSIDTTDSPRQVHKGILTPSKRRPGRPRKSVTFGEGEVDLGFTDIPGKRPKASLVELHMDPAKAGNGEAEEEADEDDDAACAICSGLNTTKKNPIIFCDGEDCEYAAHRSCENLSIVPEGDWFCKDCQFSSELEAEDVVESEMESDDSEDVACAVCSGLDSKGKNPIILCDGEDCDYAAHIKCSQLFTVPRGEWFCEGCNAKNQGNPLFLQLNDGLAQTSLSNNLPDIEGFEGHLRHMQRALLDNLTGQKRTRLQGYEDEMKKVHQVVEQTVLAGEGNSMLVIGARGSGKTTVSYLGKEFCLILLTACKLVESVISDLSDQRENFHVVRLNGFIHTDDKLALKEIWRQLGREMELGDETAGKV
jgi:origin recognition complex subunit 4